MHSYLPVARETLRTYPSRIRCNLTGLKRLAAQNLIFFYWYSTLIVINCRKYAVDQFIRCQHIFHHDLLCSRFMHDCLHTRKSSKLILYLANLRKESHLLR